MLCVFALQMTWIIQRGDHCIRCNCSTQIWKPQSDFFLFSPGRPWVSSSDLESTLPNASWPCVRTRNTCTWTPNARSCKASYPPIIHKNIVTTQRKIRKETKVGVLRFVCCKFAISWYFLGQTSVSLQATKISETFHTACLLAKIPLSCIFRSVVWCVFQVLMKPNITHANG